MAQSEGCGRNSSGLALQSELRVNVRDMAFGRTLPDDKRVFIDFPCEAVILD